MMGDKCVIFYVPLLYAVLAEMGTVLNSNNNHVIPTTLAGTFGLLVLGPKPALPPCLVLLILSLSLLNLRVSITMKEVNRILLHPYYVKRYAQLLCVVSRVHA
jgi:hypothetical protein